MDVPSATYRLQINEQFTLEDASETLSYLSQLGISHVYCSPIFKARRGSKHGYDVADPNLVNEEIGGFSRFESFAQEARAKGLGLILDIVPNHMSYSPDNELLMDVFRNGASSKYRGLFDVDWNHPSPILKGKILAPFLEKDFCESLIDGQIQLAFDDAFKIKYSDLGFPVQLNPGNKAFNSLGETAKRLIGIDGSRDFLKNKSDRALIENLISKINGDLRLLRDLLDSQDYKLASYALASKEINYRRFFAVNELIAIRVELASVFRASHRLILDLVSRGLVSGLRVDHIDGLSDPENYLLRLRESAKDAYVVVEKILESDEALDGSWPVQGTTGYDFLSRLNSVFAEEENRNKVDAIYSSFTGNEEPFEETLHRCKKLVVKTLFQGEVDNLARMFFKAIGKRSYGRSCIFRNVRRAIEELLISFSVYRTYLSGKRRKRKDVDLFERALRQAISNAPEAVIEIKLIARILAESESRKDALSCFMRLQQFTGAVMAKGLEDTTLYVYNRLLSLNEVGGDPSVFGLSVDDFHSFNVARKRKWPFSMNSTSTHDTKRGEDVRARLNVLSEMPSEFKFHLREWASLNGKKKAVFDGRLVPDSNEEYYAYQTLIGSFPFDSAELQEYEARVKAHLIKAVREAKIHSSWAEPNTEYEKSLNSFVGQILDHADKNEFLQCFLPFQKKVAFYGVFNSLSQTLLKIVSPGVPDFYQGTELWDLNLVDPDNRRLVDFAARKKLLKEVSFLKNARSKRLQKALSDPCDGLLKLFEIYRALTVRKEEKQVFFDGAYVPLQIKGKRSNHIIAFCRRNGDEYVAVIVPRFLTSLIGLGEAPLGNRMWDDTCILLPDRAPNRWTESFSGRIVEVEEAAASKRFAVGDILEDFPVALLTSSTR